MKLRFDGHAYCDGYGTLICHCGGDLCVCGLDGEDCPGCKKCERNLEELYEDELEWEARP